MLERQDGRVGVNRRRSERFALNCIVEVDNYGEGSVMVWGAISYARETQLAPYQDNLNAARYRNEILQPNSTACY